MEQKKQEFQIELTPEVANGLYSNLAVISHGANEVFMDFISMTPNMPKAKVVSRIIMTSENAKNILFAISDNIKKYEETFGTIERKLPKKGANGGNNGGEIPNPFVMGGQA